MILKAPIETRADTARRVLRAALVDHAPLGRPPSPLTREWIGRALAAATTGPGTRLSVAELETIVDGALTRVRARATFVVPDDLADAYARARRAALDCQRIVAEAHEEQAFAFEAARGSVVAAASGLVAAIEHAAPFGRRGFVHHEPGRLSKLSTRKGQGRRGDGLRAWIEAELWTLEQKRARRLAAALDRECRRAVSVTEPHRPMPAKSR